MTQITTIEALEALYEDAVPAALTKVTSVMTPLYRQWIEASRFAVLSTVGPEGTDASPRGDDGSVVRVVDEMTLHMADWRGNNRLDSLRNIVRDGRVSLMFMVPGCNNVVRINGSAVLTTEPELISSFAKNDKTPRTVIVVTIGEMYFQCAKAIMRSEIWNGKDESAKVPSAGDLIAEMKADFDGRAYDVGYAEYAKPRMW
ncbi:pyridoxamine 5'-phosphate oxidase family protein [Jannaschia sp. CCS1]|uniref:pyridoxamine 5'-phosphate oxidase family protein n=1 Tax=Jannaschia sp. (strain CCS1) TaxID=290400 RepID=UPI000053C818|nr:pyridoxamine 5'-phosphate oxidase family protein [Jannaschia sp. CCS1]ABD56647.1 pyridoxamine 5'-phosphate oxidase-related FMN-binding protein [Jannaschia sp. CCS1]